jgi:hypothetical protein
VSDTLIVTLGLLLATLACLAKPCRPSQWSHVKACRSALGPLPMSVPAPALDPERAPESVPGFADGLSVTA